MREELEAEKLEVKAREEKGASDGEGYGEEVLQSRKRWPELGEVVRSSDQTFKVQSVEMEAR